MCVTITKLENTDMYGQLLLTVAQLFWSPRC